MGFRLWLEIFDRIQPFDWLKKSKDKWMADFSISDKKYVVIFTYTGDGEWIVDFYLVKPGKKLDAKITGTGDAFVVFSTVIEIIKDFSNNAKPLTAIEFNAAEPSRQSLYKAMVKKLTMDGWEEDHESSMWNGGFRLVPSWVHARNLV